MKKAMQEVIELKIAVKTLQRHIKTGSYKNKLGRFTTVFTAVQEQELLDYLFQMDDMFYGL